LAIGDGRAIDTGDAKLDTAVTKSTSNVISASAGWMHVCAVRSNMRLYCLGDNSYGQIGDEPQIVSSWTRISTGYLNGKQLLSVGLGARHTCAITLGNQLACWGSNGSGQLGDGSLTNRIAPKLIDGGYLAGKRTVAVSGGSEHTCAVLFNGKLACWGWNYAGQLGDGTLRNRPLPKLIDGGFLAGKEVFAVSAGHVHTCALTLSGQVACWGSNSFGQLGDGTLTDRSEPKLINGGFLAGKSVIAIGTGRDHTCALTTSMQIACWGGNDSGQLGDGTLTNQSVPKLINGGFLAGKNVAVLEVGWSHICAITSSAQVACWGNNDLGQLGDGTTNIRKLPVRAQMNGAAAVGAVTGWGFTLAFTGGGQIRHGFIIYDECSGIGILSRLRPAC